MLRNSLLALLFVDFLLRNQAAVYEQIRTRRGLSRISVSLIIMSILLTGFYGSTMGLHNGWKQAASSAIKLPLLFLATAGISLPTLYVFNVLLGQRFRFLQTVALLTSALGTTSILLGSLAPVALFFTWTGSSYPFLKLLHVSFLGMSGLFGVQYLYRGCRHVAEQDGGIFQSRILKLWILIYSVVGMQLGWRLRPFLGAHDRPFELLRSVQGNFYTAVLQAVRDLG